MAAAADGSPGARHGQPVLSLSDPAANAEAISPSDSADLGFVTRGIYVGVTGDVTVNMMGTGASILFKAVPAGVTLAVRATRVLAAGTTATQLVGLY